MQTQPAILSRMAAVKGRKGDTRFGHLSDGDYVVPRAIVMKDPAILSRVKKQFDDEGQDYRTHWVGSGHENINPSTGQPEFFFLGKIGKTIAKAAPAILGGVLGSTVLPGIGYGITPLLGGALGTGAGTLAGGGSPTDALLAGAGSYLGGQFLGTGTGDLAGNLTQSTIPGAAGLGELLATAAPAIGGVGFNQLTGQLAGGAVTDLLTAPPPTIDQPTAPAGPTGPTNAPVTRPKEAALPSMLGGDFGSLDPFQRETALATQGSFGQGLGKDEQDYFLNLLQRRLQDDQGNAADFNIAPVEQNYLESGLGLQFDPNTKGLLQSIANRQAGMA